MKWDWARLCKPSHFWVSNNFRAKIALNEKHNDRKKTRKVEKNVKKRKMTKMQKSQNYGKSRKTAEIDENARIP